MQLLRSARGRFAALLAFTLLTAGSPHSVDAQEFRIAAVVNDDVISMSDVDDRVRLVIASTNLQTDPRVTQQVRAQVLRTLIDEKLELQEAKKETVSVGLQDVTEAMSNIEQQNKMPKGGIDTFLKNHNINRQTMVDQITAQIAWAKTVRRRFMHSVIVSDEEISEQLKEEQANAGKPLSRVAEIYLSVDNPSQDTEIRETAQHLVEEIRHGAPFPAVARQFSQSSTAGIGGDIGYVQPGQLDPEADKLITQLQPGQMIGPVRLTGGYYIYLLIDRRAPSDPAGQVQVNLTQVVFPIPEGSDSASVIAKAKAATADAKSCGELTKIGRDVSPDLSGPIGDVKVSDLPAEVRSTVLGAKVATPTDPIPVRNGIGVFMVCSRQGGDVEETRDRIQDNITRARLENLARGYLRDLRQVAFIDLRV
ncbi:MAG TPA: peptidylprolyl isomerase [Aliidongia sp.]|uniref:peptidylprolyl isomerase n=1 Tax=Aliidongia sp. TaxID=1914230 RepID=UPI002DDD44C7|nr:peptidylprolyl isomerase [Aliidongia sp.]HEV2675929.1 peptidylprolyl isomerase [Aliidongia sp.]